MKQHSSFPYSRWSTNNHSALPETNHTIQSSQNLSDGLTDAFCECLGTLQHLCVRLREPAPVSNLQYNSEMGRMLYTVAILSLFALVILLLMIRSIKRSNATIEVETLLESMRFRAELDIQHRQRRRLQKAKNKVTAWLTRTNGKMWQSSPQIILPNTTNSTNNVKPQRLGKGIRNDSMQSSNSGMTYLPEIVISKSDDVFLHKRNNSYTPSLSLLYDFDARSRKNSYLSETSDTIDLSQMSDISYPDHFLDPHNFAGSPQPMGSQMSLNAVAGSLGTSSI
ncbi:Protein MPS-1 [Aphelenchoides besseyi]|nr:Protein MPS-1 [Aphelenchoides besseyi]KAI6194069.1 Protein MPS-1 [Aphelenchoides besseyi]